MTTIEVRSQVSLPDLLKGVTQLDLPELEQFIMQVLTLRAQRVTRGLPKEEADLLQRINRRWSLDLQQRYDDLTAKRHAETLTPEEHSELLNLIAQVEQADAERAQLITHLAQMRNIPVLNLMQDLGIQSATHG